MQNDVKLMFIYRNRICIDVITISNKVQHHYILNHLNFCISKLILNVFHIFKKSYSTIVDIWFYYLCMFNILDKLFSQLFPIISVLVILKRFLSL